MSWVHLKIYLSYFTKYTALIGGLGLYIIAFTLIVIAAIAVTGGDALTLAIALLLGVMSFLLFKFSTKLLTWTGGKEYSITVRRNFLAGLSFLIIGLMMWPMRSREKKPPPFTPEQNRIIHRKAEMYGPRKVTAIVNLDLETGTFRRMQIVQRGRCKPQSSPDNLLVWNC